MDSPETLPAWAWIVPCFAQNWRDVLLGDVCVYCGAIPSGLDHIEPVLRSGANGYQNRAPACRRCDGEKAGMPMLLYLLYKRGGTMPRQKSRNTFIPHRYQLRPLRVRLHEHVGLPYPKAEA